MYLLGTVVVGLPLASVAAVPVYALLIALDVSDAMLNALTGAVGVIAWGAGAFLVYQVIRDDYEYVRSAEYPSQTSDASVESARSNWGSRKPGSD